MSDDGVLREHQRWLDYLQPDGLVVSAAALVDAGVLLDRAVLVPTQQRLLTHLHQAPDAGIASDGAITSDGSSAAGIHDLTDFLTGFLAWPPELLHGADAERPLDPSLTVVLPEFGEHLMPTLALRDAARSSDNDATWLLLVMVVPRGDDLDQPFTTHAQGWNASHTRRFERLLRGVGVPTGILTNRTHLRIVHAPRGENLGSLTFRIADLVDTAARPMVGALDMLLGAYRLLAAPPARRLPALLRASREYQSRVSTELARQVLDALYELLRGIEAADHHAKRTLLAEALAADPDDVYTGLLTVLMRLVFLLYAEDRALLPQSDLYARHYGVHGLHDQLRADAERNPDTMEHRYGAWARLATLFRLVHAGCTHPDLTLPAREGHLFDPDRFPWLERTPAGEIPLVADGVVHRILDKLLVLGGERLSYRTLDVEQIGSVYETMMGFRLERAEGCTIALRPAKSTGAPVPVDLDRLLATDPAKRAATLAGETDQTPGETLAAALRGARTTDDLVAALAPRMHRVATPHPVAKGTLLLRPTDERRRSGSHYTPRALTEPIVRRTLAPVLAALGPDPQPDEILSLRVCDPAMGSGAFLVEACRQLATALVDSWARWRIRPPVPDDEDDLLHAMRIVAPRCLYGVDRNPMAVDLAKLSLWLATLARNHPFTFLDHSLRSGDTLVGLPLASIAAFHWMPPAQTEAFLANLEQTMRAAARHRVMIAESADAMEEDAKREHLAQVEEEMELPRLAGDAVVAAFFAGGKPREREQVRMRHAERLRTRLQHDDTDAADVLLEAVDALRAEPHPVRPFHWELEFPEVFAATRGGFDCIVGNPPFAGKNTLIAGNRTGYLDWLQMLHGGADGSRAHGNADLVAHFFRRAFALLRDGGCFGLIATNTIAQGDTRATGLRAILEDGGTIYEARRRYKWPGAAAVIVSVVHVRKGAMPPPLLLDGREVERITAFLFDKGTSENPATLVSNGQKCFQGCIPLVMGFTFDDSANPTVASSIAEMENLLMINPKNSEVVYPYIGGDEVNKDPQHRHRRYIINFGVMSLEEASEYGDMLNVVRAKVKPYRDNQNDAQGREYWWRFLRPRPELNDAIRPLSRVIVRALTSSNFPTFTFLDSKITFDQTLIVIASSECSLLAVLLSRTHESWSLFFGSTMKDDPRYNIGKCFETFPFPENWESNAALEEIGRRYYEFRAELMVRNDEGLTKTYNRFHDPDERSEGILRLRALHAEIDRAVLDAYGWSDIQPVCEFILEYDDDETSTRRRKPWRYRWPDDIRDDVLARLLALNTSRANGAETPVKGRWTSPSTTDDSSTPDAEVPTARRRRPVEASPRRRGRPPSRTN